MKKQKVNIGNFEVGNGCPTYVIAEAGVNHNGDILLAKKLIDAAKIAGADAIKFQTFKSDKLVTKSASQADYQKANTQIKQSQFDMLKALELSYEAFKELKSYSDEKGITFLSTPFDDESLAFLMELGIPASKVSSGDLTNHPFLEKMAKYPVPVILSTGMSNMTEVKEAYAVLKGAGATDVIILHCTTNYPCPLNEVNLNAMITLDQELDCLMGYSDHTLGILVPSLAVAKGAHVIEKHFTLDKNMAGPDHKASLNPIELKEMIDQIRDVEIILGNGIKAPMPSELKVANVARKSLVVSRDLKKDTVLHEDDLIAKRPGTGISPAKINEVIGQTLKIHKSTDSLLKWEDLL